MYYQRALIYRDKSEIQTSLRIPLDEAVGERMSESQVRNFARKNRCQTEDVGFSDWIKVTRYDSNITYGAL